MPKAVLHFPVPQQPPPGPPPERGPGLPLPVVFVAPVWTYRHVQRPLAELTALSEAELDALGAEGWELAGVTAEGQTAHFFFKRLVR